MYVLLSIRSGILWMYVLLSIISGIFEGMYYCLYKWNIRMYVLLSIISREY